MNGCVAIHTRRVIAVQAITRHRPARRREISAKGSGSMRSAVMSIAECAPAETTRTAHLGALERRALSDDDVGKDGRLEQVKTRPCQRRRDPTHQRMESDTAVASNLLDAL